MANLGVLLKDEIKRLARRELKRELAQTQKASAQQRRSIAALKRTLAQLEKKIAQLERQNRKAAGQTPVPADTGKRARRFTAKGLRSQRKRLGLSAAHYAQLVGVSALTIYNWERGTTRPRKAQLAGLSALRGIGKREAQRRLKELGSAAPKKKGRGKGKSKKS